MFMRREDDIYFGFLQNRHKSVAKSGRILCLAIAVKRAMRQYNIPRLAAMSQIFFQPFLLQKKTVRHKGPFFSHLAVQHRYMDVSIL